MQRINWLLHCIIFCFLVYLLPAWAKNDLELTFPDDSPTIHSVIFYLDALQKQQQHYRVHHQINSQSPCHIYVNESDSEDLYQKAFSDTPCTLFLNGEYVISSSLPSSIKMKAILDPEPIDSSAQHKFTNINLEPAAFPGSEKMLLTRSLQGLDQGDDWVKPAAVLVIAQGVNNKPVTLPDHIADSGIGITLDHPNIHQSGCQQTSIATSSTHKRTVLWSNDQVNRLCTQKHYNSANGKARECPATRGKIKASSNHSSKKDGGTYTPTEEVSTQARQGATSYAATGAGGGGDDKKDDSKRSKYLYHFNKIKNLFLQARGGGAKGAVRSSLKLEWRRVPEMYKESITKYLDGQYPGPNSFSKTLSKCPP